MTGLFLQYTILISLTGRQRMFDLINLYQGLIVFIQVGLASLNAILCCRLYRFCTKAVIKNKSEELKDETVYAVYQLSFMMIYIGVS